MHSLFCFLCELIFLIFSHSFIPSSTFPTLANLIMSLLACVLDNVNLICKAPKNNDLWLPFSFLLCSLPYLLSVCPRKLAVSFSGNFSVSKANLFIEPQRSAIRQSIMPLKIDISKGRPSFP